jgi:nucleoid-associated protein YgaU
MRETTLAMVFVLLFVIVLTINIYEDNHNYKIVINVIEHHVQKGDTLSRIAQLYYKDTSMWTHISKFNHLQSSLIDGTQTLLVPMYAQ